MILGEFRKEGGISVREKLGVCSFDVLVRRHRLLYASRVARKASSLLHVLLQGGAVIPWTKALVDDLAALKRAAPKKLEELPPFEADPQKWIMLWTRYPRQWAQLVKLLPLNDYDDEVDDLPDALVTCEICSKRFISTRALAVHLSRCWCPLHSSALVLFLHSVACLSLLIQLCCSPVFSGFLVGSRVIGTVRKSRSKIKIMTSSHARDATRRVT